MSERESSSFTPTLSRKLWTLMANDYFDSRIHGAKENGKDLGVGRSFDGQG